LQKSFIKFITLSFSIVVFVLVVFTAGITIFLSGSKDQLQKSLTKIFAKEVSISSIDYFPPNQILLQDVSIGEDISINSIKLTFSLPTLVRKRDLICAIRKGKITSSDLLDADKNRRYNFVGIFTEEGLVIKELKFSEGDFSLKLWGGLQNKTLKLRGFSMLEKHFRSHVFQNPNIIDIDCLINLSLPKVHIEELHFSYNKLPFLMRGDVFFGKSITTDLELYAQSVKVGLKNLAFHSFSSEKLEIYFQEIALSSASNGSNNLPLKDCKLFFDLEDRNVMFFDFNSKIYNGSLTGQGYLDLNRFPSKCAFRAKTKEVSANRFGESLEYLSDIYGRLQAEFYYQSHPDVSLAGQIAIDKGYLDKMDFFLWFADTFDLSSLQKVNFDKLGVDFLTDGKIMSAEQIRLDSSNITLDGYFNFKNNLLSSQISIALSRQLLQSSPKFKALLKRLKEDVDFLVLDFQLSGSPQAMNFKWLDSEFKNKLEKLLPGRMERGIEEEIEKLIQSVSQNQ